MRQDPKSRRLVTLSVLAGLSPAGAGVKPPWARRMCRAGGGSCPGLFAESETQRKGFTACPDRTESVVCDSAHRR